MTLLLASPQRRNEAHPHIGFSPTRQTVFATSATAVSGVLGRFQIRQGTADLGPVSHASGNHHTEIRSLRLDGCPSHVTRLKCRFLTSVVGGGTGVEGRGGGGIAGVPL